MYSAIYLTILLYGKKVEGIDYDATYGRAASALLGRSLIFSFLFFSFLFSFSFFFLVKYLLFIFFVSNKYSK